MGELKIKCYMCPDECRECGPTGWCSRFDCMCEYVHIDLYKEDGEE